MTDIKRIRALERGIQLLEVLTASAGSSLHQLHVLTGLPKSTLRRLLATLEAAGAVRKGLADGLYRANINLRRIPAHLHQFDYLIEAALPVLKALGRESPWPSDLFVRNGNYMQVVETTRGLSALSLTIDLVGDLVYIPVTATGRAYLAFCPESERREILESLRREAPADTPASFWQRLESVLLQTRAQGYGVRAVGFYGQTRNRPTYIDGLSAIAVPIILDGKVHGCINRMWPRAAMGLTEFTRQNLASLQAAADEIASRLSPLETERPATQSPAAVDSPL